MKIVSLTFKNKAYEWEVEDALFDDIVLLVGASGVGKTQILSAISSLKSIANGNFENGAEWCVRFLGSDGILYQWEGAFTINKAWIDSMSLRLDKEYEKNRPDIVYERILKDGKLIVDRNNSEILLNGNPIVKLSQKSSAVHLLEEVPEVKEITDSFKSIVDREFDYNVYYAPVRAEDFNVERLIRSYKTFESLVNSEESSRVKLFASYRLFRDKFEEIALVYKQVFPKVEALKIDFIEAKRTETQIWSFIPRVQIKEKGVERWIPDFRMSLGMLKTLVRIAEINLSRTGSVFLIDEFENSLGINCIDDITDQMLNAGRKLQFIITSHHPYIINNVDFRHWRLITRQGGIIKMNKTEELGLGNSRHEKFLQLINLKQYKTGSE